MSTRPDIPDQTIYWNARHAKYHVLARSLPVSPKCTETAELFLSAGVRNVLDVGCGPGRWAVFMARLGFNVVGVDISQTAADLAARWAADESLPASFAVADVRNLPLGDGAFDAVVASDVIEHLQRKGAEAAIKEIGRVLTPGGLLFASFSGNEPEAPEHYALPDGSIVFTAPERNGLMWRYYSDPEIRQLLCEFEILDWQETPSGDRWVYAKLRD